MKIIMIICLFFIKFSIVIAQQNTNYGQLANQQGVREEIQNVITKGNNFRHAYGFNNTYKGVVGSPFYYNNWCSGKMVLNNIKDTIFTPDVKFRFDALNNELWILKTRDSLIAFSKDINYFELHNKFDIEKFVKIEESMIDADKNRFYKLVFKNEKIRFYQDTKKVLKPANFIDKGMYSTGDPYDSIIEKYQYLIAINYDPITPIKNTTKDLIKAFSPKYKMNAVNYFKEKKLKGQLSEQEIHMFLEHMTSLL